jgi:murein DD-endopeptidase MepM/ murein hydrolase activator NlpD
VSAFAQSSGPVYIVQPGDSLSTIAGKFNVSMDELMQANGISDPNQIQAGQELIIPGLEGVSGVLDTEVIQFGDSYRSLLRRTQLPEDLFDQLNHLVSPTEFYVGASMTFPVDQVVAESTSQLSTGAGESLLELAIKNDINVWNLTGFNHLKGTWSGIPGDVLYRKGGPQGSLATGLPSAFISADIRDLPIKQGGTGVIKIKTTPETTLGGLLVDHELNFFSEQDGLHIALQGVHALLDPGVYPLRLDATQEDGTTQSYEQMILITSGFYNEITIPVPSETLNPSVTDPENQLLIGLTGNISPTKKWQGKFKLPVDTQACIKDWFGIRRTYYGIGTDITLNGFHSGVDYGICSETHPFDIYAPAAGTVVFSGPLTVRGNATIIDHGWGVLTGYWHQEQSYVAVGDHVETGNLIGKIGGTGRVTGPHLHWEVWVNGVQVDPLDWLDKEYP